MCRYCKLLINFTIFFAGIFLFVVSCQRNKDCDVVINVADGYSGAPVNGATVHMYIPPGSPPPTNGNLTIQDQTGVTDASGSVSFTFKLPAILQADVTPVATSTLTPTTKLVKLEEGKQVSTTVKLY
jgi:hypothetical protein